MTRPDCPSDETLQNLISGKLEDAVAEVTLNHIAKCADCESRMESVAGSSDSFVGHEVAAAGQHTQAAAFERAANRIKHRAISDDPTVLLELVPGPAARYSRSEVHASGGVGNVWRAADNALGREVALKELRIDQGNSARTVNRFLNEARVTGQLAHPGIVPVYDVGFADGKPFYTMKFVQGKTLHQSASEFAANRSSGSADILVLRRLINVVIDVANAIAYAHSRGVLHRDLKGKNIVLGDFGEVLVLDWGLARLIDAEDSDDASHDTVSISASGSTTRTEDGSVVGTPSFMSPEQALGKRAELNERTDVYGLGAVLYECLTGQPPYGSGDSSEVLKRAIQGNMPRPRDHWHGVPRELEAICEKALSREQKDRYLSASEFAADLERWLADEPVAVFRESVSKRFFRWARRNQTLVAAGTALSLMTIVALATTAFLVSREQAKTAKAQARAEANFDRANETVSSLLGEIGDLRLEVVPELDRLRESMLTKAIAFNQKFLTTSPIAEVRYEAALAHSRIAVLQAQLGKMKESVSSSRQAIGILEELQAAGVDQPGLLFELGRELQQVTRTLDAIGQRDEAVMACAEAVSTFKQSKPGVYSADLHLLQTASALGMQAAFSSEIGDASVAEDLFAEAFEMLDQISDEGSSRVATLETKALLNRRLSLHLQPTERITEAVDASREACDLLEKATRVLPEDLEVLHDLTDAVVAYAGLLQVTGQRPEAARQFERGIELNETLVERSPYTITYQLGLVDGYTGLGMTLSNLGEVARAEQQFNAALKQAEVLLKRFPDTVAVRYAAAKSRMRAGIWLINNSRPLEALPQVKQAVDELAALADEVPDVVDYRYQLAVDTGTLALVQSRLGGTDTQHFATADKAIRILEQLCKEHPEAIDYQHKLGINYRNLGRFYQSANQPDEARQFFQKSIDSHRRTVAISKEKPRHERQLGIALFMLGRYCWKLDDEKLHQEAEQHMLEALRIREALLEAEPEWNYAKMDVVLSHLDIGQLLIQMEKFDDAATHLRTGADICKEVVDAGRQGAAALREYAECTRQLAIVRLEQDQFTESLSILDKAIASFQDARELRPDREEYAELLRQALINRGEALCRLQRIDDAVASIAEMLTIESPVEYDYLEAAEVLVLCSTTVGDGREEQAGQLQVQAIEHLKIALAKGLDPAEIVEDRKLDPIRDRAEFQALFPEKSQTEEDQPRMQ